MSPETNTSKTTLCPVCGTRINESANKCLVCGTKINETLDSKKPADVRAKRLPEITLSLPAALGLLALLITLGAVVVFLVLQSETPEETIGTLPEVGTATASPTVTETPTVTPTATEGPTWTPLPPIEYTVKPGDSCAGVAAAFGVSVQSIILENNLAASCQLNEDQVLMIPQPTPTATPQTTATLSDVEKTEAACETINYTVSPNDTLSSIANTYNVSMAVIRDYNGMLSDTVFEGQTLLIPLCLRQADAGPTPTPTELPPYPAPNLLLPADGASFTSETDTIALQWAAVGELEANEAYAVTITDLTSEDKLTTTEYVKETSFIVPSSFAPTDGRAHIYRWSINIVRQIGSDEENGDNWEIAGTKSDERVFSWSRVAAGSQP
jgi:LysM repeat protein